MIRLALTALLALSTSTAMAIEIQGHRGARGLAPGSPPDRSRAATSDSCAWRSCWRNRRAAIRKVAAILESSDALGLQDDRPVGGRET